jgi:hypothetical protein
MRSKKNFARLVGSIFTVGLLATAPTQVLANGIIVAPNGFTQIGINDNGSLDANSFKGLIGIGYNFTGQGSRTGFQDALTPGCPCESWGISGNGLGGAVGPANGNQNIGVNNSSAGTSTNTSAAAATASFVSNTFLNTLPGLTVTQSFSVSAQSGTGGLFKDTVTIHNGTAATINDVRYTRAMDWDVPPTEFAEFVTHKGTTTTASLLRSTDDGFANANPITAVTNTGIVGPINADGTTGPADHGSLFVFGFGNLAAGADKTFNIFYGAGANEADALTLLSLISPELYSLGQSSLGGSRRPDLPTFIFAFNGVGGSIIVPPPDGGGRAYLSRRPSRSSAAVSSASAGRAAGKRKLFG